MKKNSWSALFKKDTTDVRNKHNKNPGAIEQNHWVLCDLCGCDVRFQDSKQNWQGQIVCPDDYDIRNEQDFVKGIKNNPDNPEEGLILRAPVDTTFETIDFLPESSFSPPPTFGQPIFPEPAPPTELSDYYGYQNNFKIFTAQNIQTTPAGKVGSAYGASVGQSGGNIFFPLTDDVGDIRYETSFYPYLFVAGSSSEIAVNGIYQFQYPDGSSFLKLVIDSRFTLPKHEVTQVDVVNLRIFLNAGTVQYVDFFGEDATFTSLSGATTMWEWTLPSGFLAFGPLNSYGEQNINITTYNPKPPS